MSLIAVLNCGRWHSYKRSKIKNKQTVHLHKLDDCHKEFMMTTCFNPLCSEWYLFCLAFIVRVHDFSKFLDEYILDLVFGVYISVVLRLCCLCLTLLHSKEYRHHMGLPCL
jgi:hypothetical protein